MSMTRSVLLLSFCLFLIGKTHAQYSTEFGIDLIIPIVLTSGHQAKTTGVEVFYKENLPDMDTRFKFFITSDVDEFKLFRRSTIDSTFVYNYYLPDFSVGTNIGLAKIIKVKGQNLYYGADLHFSVQRGTSIATDSLLRKGDLPTDIIRRYRDFDYAVGFIPFLGTKIRLSEHIHFTLEFGPLLQYRFGKRSFLNSSGQNDQLSIKYLEFLAGRWLNDIAVSYRF